MMRGEGDMANKVGDTLEVALWFNSEHSVEEENARRGIMNAFLVTESQHELEVGPVTFEILSVGDARVPEPSPKFAGTPKLMLGFADVVKLTPATIGNDIGFTYDLEPEDLQKLRDATQRAYATNHMGQKVRPLTDEQLDDIINEVGPSAVLKGLERDAAQSTLH